ncbi:MAG: dipeptide epimerase [Planctomycetota bacterium]|jgi:L-alanine-DL-glutamate epimerase-like enolase superfamily enzyme
MMISRKEFLKMIAVAGAGWPAILALGNNKSKGPARFTLSTKRLLLRHTWTISRNSSDFKDNVFVRIERDGVVGLGEAAPNIRYGESAEKTLAVLHNARGLFESSDWFRYVDMQKEWEVIIKEQRCAGAALDMAVLDWVGRKLKAPFYRLLGLDERKTAVTSFSIGIDTPQIVKQKVREAVDFPILKIKVGRDNDEEILKAVRDVTDKPLYVDANEAWRDKRLALEKISRLQSLGVVLIEQPLPAEMIEETAWLRQRVHIPIIADEAVKRASDIPKLAGAYDGINIKLMKAGGIQEAIRMIHLARALGMKVMLGCMIESSLAITAAAHLTPLADYADLDGNLLISNDPFTGVSVEQGKMILNDRPGLGVSERPLQ